MHENILRRMLESYIIIEMKPKLSISTNKTLTSWLQGDLLHTLSCLGPGQYTLTKWDCPNDYELSSRKISIREALDLVTRQGATGLHFHVLKQDLLDLGFDEKLAQEWIAELDACWIAGTVGEKNGNPRLAYMV